MKNYWKDVRANLTNLTIGFLILNIAVGSQLAQADSANPPRVLMVKLVNPKVFSSGDEIAFDIYYSGGNPGIKTASINFKFPYDQRCIGLGNGVAWNPKATNSYGPIPLNALRLYGIITSDCIRGDNFVDAIFVQIKDETDLSASATFIVDPVAGTSPSINKITVLDGHFVQPGIAVTSRTPAVVDLTWLKDSYVVPKEGNLNIELPRKNKMGQLIFYQTFIGDWERCKITGGDGSWSGFTLTLYKDGACKVLAAVNISRGETVSGGAERELVVISEATLKAEAEAKAKAEAEAKSKAEAEAKAKAEAEAKTKAAAELKAKQEAEAKAAAAEKKKTTITCVKGKISKKVTAVKPKCPAGYKKK